MPHEPVAIGTQLLGPADLPADERVHSWHEQVPSGSRDGTLLAVVPIPGTGTSLAIVSYVVTAGPSPATASPSATAPSATAPSATAASATGPATARPEVGPASASGLHLDHAQRRAWADGDEIELTFQEFELLAFLTAHPATVFSRADLVEQAWHRDPGRDSRTVDVHISRVRRKLGPRYGQCLVTEYRTGYRFRPLTSP